MASFKDKLKVKWNEDKFVCIGLDKGEFEFNKAIIDQTAQFICAYKPNVAFYEAEGLDGWKALKETIQYIHQNYTDIPIILDAKRGDIGSTNEAYAKAVFDDLEVDAVTVSPYLGQESLQPFLDREDRGIIILVKTSNHGAGEFQDLKVDGKPLNQIVAQHIVSKWNKNGNCAIVVGATYPQDLKTIREIVGDMPILIPGVGAQNGDLLEILKNGLDSNKQGLIISSSRSIILAQNPKEAALKMHQDIVDLIKTI